MDDEKISRRVKPHLVIATTVSLKRWVQEQARRQETTQAEIVNALIVRERERLGEIDGGDAREEVA